MHPGAALDPRVFSHRRPLNVTPSPEGLSRLGLTADDAALLRADLADLRVADDAAQQWPYLSSSRPRRTDVALEVGASRPERRRSRYALALPVAPLRVERMALRSQASFFDRPYRLFGVDAHGREQLVSEGRLVKRGYVVAREQTAGRGQRGRVWLSPRDAGIYLGELVATAAKLDLPIGVKVKDKSQYKLIGRGLGHWDAPQIVTGKAIYGLDVRLPGMLFAALARCPVFGGKLAGVDSSAAETFPGVRHVLTIENQVAVVAENSWAAIQGRNALKVTWDEGIESINSTLSSENFIKTASASLTKSSKPNPAMLEAVYYTPYEAHATMEPMDCVAYVHDGICEVWAPTQNPQAVRRDAAMAAGISQEKVIVNVPLIGGGFGRRLQTDYAVEAVKVSKLVLLDPDV